MYGIGGWGADGEWLGFGTQAEETEDGGDHEEELTHNDVGKRRRFYWKSQVAGSVSAALDIVKQPGRMPQNIEAPVFGLELKGGMWTRILFARSIRREAEDLRILSSDVCSSVIGSTLSIYPSQSKS